MRYRRQRCSRDRSLGGIIPERNGRRYSRKGYLERDIDEVDLRGTRFICSPPFTVFRKDISATEMFRGEVFGKEIFGEMGKFGGVAPETGVWEECIWAGDIEAGGMFEGDDV